MSMTKGAGPASVTVGSFCGACVRSVLPLPSRTLPPQERHRRGSGPSAPAGSGGAAARRARRRDGPASRPLGELTERMGRAGGCVGRGPRRRSPPRPPAGCAGAPTPWTGRSRRLPRARRPSAGSRSRRSTMPRRVGSATARKTSPAAMGRAMPRCQSLVETRNHRRAPRAPNHRRPRPRLRPGRRGVLHRPARLRRHRRGSLRRRPPLDPGRPARQPRVAHPRHLVRLDATGVAASGWSSTATTLEADDERLTPARSRLPRTSGATGRQGGRDAARP